MCDPTIDMSDAYPLHRECVMREEMLKAERDRLVGELEKCRDHHAFDCDANRTVISQLRADLAKARERIKQLENGD